MGNKNAKQKTQKTSTKNSKTDSSKKLKKAGKRKKVAPDTADKSATNEFQQFQPSTPKADLEYKDNDQSLPERKYIKLQAHNAKNARTNLDQPPSTSHSLEFQKRDRAQVANMSTKPISAGTKLEPTQWVISGFVHDMYHSMRIPPELLQVIASYYGLHFLWRLSEDEIDMNHFLQFNEQSEPIYCDQYFQIKDIQFRCKLFPPRKANKMVAFGLSMKRFSNRMEYMALYVELKCETETSSVTVKRFWRFNKRDSIHDYMLSFEHCRNAQMLHFSCFVDPIYVKYKPKHYVVPSELFKDAYFLRLPRAVMHEWKLGDDLIEQWQGKQMSHHCVYHSFGCNNWNLILYPKGPGQCIEIYLQCLLLPLGLKWIEVECSIWSEGDIEITETGKHAKYKFKYFQKLKKTAFGWKEKTVAFDALRKAKDVTICASLQIIDVVKDDEIGAYNASVPSHQWSSYGIVE